MKQGHRVRRAGPTVEQLEQELYREKYRLRYRSILRSTIYALIIVAAVSVLVATLLLPVLEIYGSSMAPTLNENDIVVSVKGGDIRQGDIIAFYYNNRILIKRVIAVGGQTVDIDADGNVSVDGELLDEPYLTEKSAGESDLTYPYTVDPETYFVMGDHRETSVDSRNSLIGCIERSEIVGRIVWTVWPLSRFGRVG
jgi:signal peptidase I